jgi:hypothetical protein
MYVFFIPFFKIVILVEENFSCTASASCQLVKFTNLLTFQSLLVTGCTNKLNILTTVRSAHTVFIRFVFI